MTMTDLTDVTVYPDPLTIAITGPGDDHDERSFTIVVRGTSGDALALAIEAAWLDEQSELLAVDIVRQAVQWECADEWPEGQDGKARLLAETAAQALRAMEAVGKLVFVDGRWRIVLTPQVVGQA